MPKGASRSIRLLPQTLPPWGATESPRMVTVTEVARRGSVSSAVRIHLSILLVFRVAGSLGIPAMILEAAGSGPHSGTVRGQRGNVSQDTGAYPCSGVRTARP